MGSIPMNCSSISASAATAFRIGAGAGYTQPRALCAVQSPTAAHDPDTGRVAIQMIRARVSFRRIAEAQTTPSPGP